MLVFPEGRGGTAQAAQDALPAARVRPVAFVETALRAGVPIVPVAVLGAEEALPMLGRIASAPAAAASGICR